MMLVAAAMLAGSLALVPRAAFRRRPVRFLFRRRQKQQAPGAAASQFLLRSVRTEPAAAQRRRAARRGSGPAFCVRSCDGKYFPLTLRGNATPVQMCQAFCPASATRSFSAAISMARPRAMASAMPIARTPSPTARRCAPTAPATAAPPSGLAPVDLTLDTSLRPGDVVATTGGLVAFTGVRLGASQTAEFTPVASYPGLTADVRARLGEMKVAPVSRRNGRRQCAAA